MVRFAHHVTHVSLFLECTAGTLWHYMVLAVIGGVSHGLQVHEARASVSWECAGSCSLVISVLDLALVRLRACFFSERVYS